MTDTSQDKDDLELIEIRNEFIDESVDGLNGAADEVIRFERMPSDTGPLDAIFRTAHSIKGNAAFFELMSLKSLAHGVENVLGALRKRSIQPSREVTDTLLLGIDELVAMLLRVRHGEKEVASAANLEQLTARLERVRTTDVYSDAHAKELSDIADKLDAVLSADDNKEGAALIARLRTVCEALSGNASTYFHDETKTDETKSAADFRTQDAQGPKNTAPRAAAPSDTGGKTMRIREDAIDGFFKFVGELVVVGEMYENLLARIVAEETNGISKAMRQANEAFRVLSHELQKSILDIRKVPAGRLLRTATRIARDVSAELGKEINVTLEGESSMIDKSIAEALDAPLVHMVRNAADHGIELPEERRAAGKPLPGNLSVSIRSDTGNVILSVEDDGKGLDREKLMQKAVSLGVISPEQPLDEKAVVELLFAAGVSTAECVTDISGRGVGMDVVKKNIDDMGGRIEVESELNVGTLFRVTLPATVSTRIIQGIGVRINQERYILPMENVVRFLQIGKHDVHSTTGSEAVVRVGEQVVPYFSLANLLNIGASRVKQNILADGIAVLIEVNEELLALNVDDIESNRQVVLKDMEGLESDADTFKGAAVLGDGTVSLVLNCESMLLRERTDISMPAC